MIQLTSAVFDLAVRLAPAERAVWLDAMRAELESMPPAQRPGFAGGCLLAALAWRVWTPAGVRMLARTGLGLASASLGALVLGLTVSGAFGPLGSLMTALAIAYATAGLATWVWGLRGMAIAALAGLALNALVTGVWFAGLGEPTAFTRALSIEAGVILAVFLGVAAGAQGLAGRLERRI
jgi:hypothetical protein